MYDPNAPRTAELPPDPFEGTDMFAPLEDLAIAEIRQRMLELGQGTDPSATLESRLLQYQLTLAECHRDELRQGRVLTENEWPAWVKQEREALSHEPGMDKSSLEPGDVIFDYGTAARWRLSRIDPNTLQTGVRAFTEAQWSEASGKTMEAQVAALDAQITQLNVNAGLAKLRGEDTGAYAVQREALYAEKHKLNRPSYGASVRSDFGTG